MPQILTSDQFVAGVVSVLALQNRKSFVLTDTDLDDRFARAYADLVDHVEEFDVVPNFSFLVDAMHGDLIRLRETLLAAKERSSLPLTTQRSGCLRSSWTTDAPSATWRRIRPRKVLRRHRDAVFSRFVKMRAWPGTRRERIDFMMIR